MKDITQRVVATDQSNRDSSCDEISQEERPPCELSNADVREHRGHDDGGELEENGDKDYPENYRRLLHG